MDRLRFQAPLSRCGTGPGLVIIVAADVEPSPSPSTLDPRPLEKWAEESYAVVQVLAGRALEHLSLVRDALEMLEGCPACSNPGTGGVIVIADDAQVARRILEFIKELDATATTVHGVVLYGCAVEMEDVPFPTLAHLPSSAIPAASSRPNAKVHVYPDTTGAFFVLPAHESYRPSAAAVAHTRSLSFLKPLMNGPLFDLEAIWDEHTRYEFADRSVEKTMATMVAEPYVNHVPTLTGGVGREALTAFYRDHFIHSNAEDAALELVSRTVGVDRIVDEFLFRCTHDRVIDWLIPGIPPTGQKLSIPFTSIVNIRGDRLFHEHISWDQGTVLRQLGLMPEYLPFPYPLPGDGTAMPGTGQGQRRWEFRVPVSGVETAQKLVDEHAVPSNGMLAFTVRERMQDREST